MKVLHLISSLAPELGGTVELVRMLSTALVHQGCTVTIVSLDKDREVLKLPSSISHITLNPPWLNIKYSFSFQLIAWLLRKITTSSASTVIGTLCSAGFDSVYVYV